MTTRREQHHFFDHDIERFLLGGILLEPEGLALAGALQPNDFHEARNAAIFGAMLKIASDPDRTISPAGILAEMNDADRAMIDQGAYLSELLDLRPSPGDIPKLAHDVLDLADKRALWIALQQTMTDLQAGKYQEIDASIVRDDHVKRLQATIRTPLEVEGRKTVWTIAELLDADFPEPRWAIPGILPVGLAFLAGRPKVGKSWLALQIAHAVGTGGALFDRKVERGRVLFLALEDGERRLQRRVQRHKIERNADITLVQEWPTFGGGGIAKLHDAIAKHGYTLTIVDTLSRAAGLADQLDLAQMTSLMGELQRVSQATDTTILVNDHHTKASGGYSPNPVNDLMGSTGKAAVGDVIMGLYKEQGKKGATLHVTGRDIEEQELVLLWHGATCTWQLQGEVGGVLADTVGSDIIAAIGALERAGKLAYGAEIARFLEKDAAQVSRELSALENKGAIVRGEKVKGKIPYRVVEKGTP